MLRSKPLSVIAPFSALAAAALVLSACAAPTPQTIIQTSPPEIQTQIVVATQLVPVTHSDPGPVGQCQG